MDAHKATLISFLILLIVTAGFTLWLVHPFLLSITMGGIISLMLKPLYLKLIQKKIGAKTSSLILTLGLILLFILPFTLLTIIAIKQGITIVHSISSNDSFSIQALLVKASQWPIVEIFFDNSVVFNEKISEWMQNNFQQLTSLAITTLSV